MADPVITPMIIGAGLGAATSDDPLKGALMGGALGGVGGHFTNGFGGMFGNPAPMGLGGSLGAGATAPGLQASGAITSAATAPALSNPATWKPLMDAGMVAGTATPAAMSEQMLYRMSLGEQGLGAVKPLTGMEKFTTGLRGMSNSAMSSMKDPKSMLKAASLLKGSPQQQQPVARGGSAPPLNPNAGGQFAGADPYSKLREEQMRMRQGLMPASSYFG